MVASAIKHIVMPLTAIAGSAQWPDFAFGGKKFEPFRSSADLILRGLGLSVCRASYSRGLVLVVAPRSTVAATGWPVREFRAADTAHRHVPAVPAPRIIGQHRNRILNVLAMPFPIRSIDHPQKVPGGHDFHAHMVR